MKLFLVACGGAEVGLIFCLIFDVIWIYLFLIGMCAGIVAKQECVANNM